MAAREEARVDQRSLPRLASTITIKITRAQVRPPTVAAANRGLICPSTGSGHISTGSGHISTGSGHIPAFTVLALCRCESELSDVPVGHDVILAFQPHSASCAGNLHRSRRDKIIERDDLSPDEASLEVAVDNTGGLGRGRPLANRPGSRLLRT